MKNEGRAQILAGCLLGLLTLALFELLKIRQNHPAGVLGVVFVLLGAVWACLRELRLAHRVDQAGNRLCLHCRYDLRDLDNSDGECPECGTAYSLPELSEAWNHLIPPWRRALAQRIFGRQA